MRFEKEHIELFRQYFISTNLVDKQNILKYMSNDIKNYLLLIEKGFVDDCEIDIIASQLGAMYLKNELNLLKQDYLYSFNQMFEDNLKTAIMLTERLTIKERFKIIDMEEAFFIDDSEMKSIITNIERASHKKNLKLYDNKMHYKISVLIISSIVILLFLCKKYILDQRIIQNKVVRRDMIIPKFADSFDSSYKLTVQKPLLVERKVLSEKRFDKTNYNLSKEILANIKDSCVHNEQQYYEKYYGNNRLRDNLEGIWCLDNYIEKWDGNKIISTDTVLNISSWAVCQVLHNTFKVCDIEQGYLSEKGNLDFVAYFKKFGNQYAYSCFFKKNNCSVESNLKIVDDETFEISYFLPEQLIHDKYFNECRHRIKWVFVWCRKFP